jgi:hypothetical protein
MKLSNVSKFVGAGALAVTLAVAPSTLPAQAQNNTNTTDTTTTTTQPNSNVDARGPITKNTERDRNHIGWFGLLGLTGLFGLAGKKRRETAHHVTSDPNIGVRTGTDYR